MDPGLYDETFRTETWDWWHVGRRQVLARVLEEALARAGLDPREAEMLDVGCGTGGTTSYLAGERPVTGCDLAGEALSGSRRRGLARLVRAGADALPFADGTFDVALALDVLEHHRDDRVVASEIARVLRPGGLLLATVPAFDCLWGPHDVLSHHHRRYRLPQLTTLLEEAGLRVSWSSYFNTWLFPGVLLVQTLRRLARRGRPAAPASDLPRKMPAFVNTALARLFGSERFVVPRWRLPVGVSALAVASRPEGP